MLTSQEQRQQIDAGGILESTTQSIKEKSLELRERWSTAGGLLPDLTLEVEAPNLREYHIQEYFENLVCDANGAILDQKAYCFDQYKVHLKLKNKLSQGVELIAAYANAAIEAFQSGAANWPNQLTLLAMDLVDPILTDVSTFSEFLETLVKVHDTISAESFNAIEA